jgi:ankyrin repeat protein
VNDASPLDGGTALFRAAAFGHTDAVRALIEHGADPASRASDARTALDLVMAARAEERDAAAARALDDVAAALRGAEKRE